MEGELGRWQPTEDPLYFNRHLQGKKFWEPNHCRIAKISQNFQRENTSTRCWRLSNLTKLLYGWCISLCVNKKRKRSSSWKYFKHSLARKHEYNTKCFTFDGSPPNCEISADLVHVGILGYNWASEEDKLLLVIKQLSFGKVKKGKTPKSISGPILGAF